MALAPLNVEVEGEDTYATWVGAHGRVYPLSFADLINLVRNRCGHEQKKIGYRR